LKKSAFTMIELVFVIIVLGILASVAMDRTDRDLKQEAAETILSHIRLAQQLALSDNKHRSDNDVRWQKAYWRFEYKACTGTSNTEWTYRVGSSIDLGLNIDRNESAVNPIDGKYLYTNGNCKNLISSESPTVLLTKKFGINNISMQGCLLPTGSTSTAKHIAFDYLGRPHRGVGGYNNANQQFSKKMISDCNLTFTLSTDQDNDGIDDNFTITIEAETGHSFIVGQENS